MCHQKKSDGASLQSEMACLDCLVTKTGPKWVRKGLMDLSTMFHGCTRFYCKGKRRDKWPTRAV
jgi:hypothetical protein